MSEDLEAVIKERNEYHEMLRTIMELCGATSIRDVLGPDAPLRAVRKLIAERDALRAQLAKYERVVAAAKALIKLWDDPGVCNELTCRMYEEDLRAAVVALEDQ